MAAPENLAIRSLRPGDIVRRLRLGAEDLQPLNTFLRRHSKQYDQHSIARTYVLVDEKDAEQDGTIWGYITLVASEVATTDQNAPPVDHWPASYSLPGIKLARMAVDQRLQGRGLGKSLLAYAAGLAKDKVCPAIGCKLLVTDAKRSAVSFYEKRGFTMLDTDENRAKNSPVMFIDIAKL